jgi:hypothetical protein
MSKQQGALLATPRESPATPLQLFVEHTLFNKLSRFDLSLFSAGVASNVSNGAF